MKYIVLDRSQLDRILGAEDELEAYELAAEIDEAEELFIFELHDVGQRQRLTWRNGAKAIDRNGAMWTAVEEQSLLADHKKGMTYSQLAEKYGRTKAAISWRLSHLRR